MLGSAGIVSLGGLLTACTRSPGTTLGVDVTTEAGTTAMVSPSNSPTTTDDGSARALLDDAVSCALTPETTEGRYFFDVDSIRSDIREDRDGITMHLAVRVQDGSDGCAPVQSAMVDIWHCDAEGLYSGYESASRGRGAGQPDDETYLRGVQVTGADGVVEFTTIYPGCYRGRAVHVHVKVHLNQRTVLTSQLFFDEAFTDEVYAAEPYASAGPRDTRIDTGDMVYDQAEAHGEPALLTLRRSGDAVLAAANIVAA